MEKHYLFFLLAALVGTVSAFPQEAIEAEEVVDVLELPFLKRSDAERHYKLNAFGEDLDLHLLKTENLLPTNLPVYVFGEDSQGTPTVDDWTHRTDGAQYLYTDKALGASLMIDETEAETKLNGLLREGLLIASVENIELDESSKDKRELKKHIRHIIYKVKTTPEQATSDDYLEVPQQDPAVAADSDKKERVERRALPQQIYVPVHVVVDYKLWTKLDRSEYEVIRYIKIFYNSVNYVYSTISWPSVAVSIQGITICKSASSCKMVEDSRLGTDGVNAKTALSAIAAYAYDQRSYTGTDYALMIVMTDYDLCSPSSSGVCQRSTAGLAYVGTACDRYAFSKTSKTGIAEDHGSFDGIKTVAHEMGHILGMNHDGDGPSTLGAPGATSCRWSDNYLMGETAFVLNQFKWSQCSVDQLRWLAVQTKASCLLDKPSASKYDLIDKLPGKEIDLDNQCRIVYGPTSEVGCRLPGVNSGNDQLCLGLMCKTSAGRCSSTNSPAEGSYCGPQRYCRSGKCVCDPTAPLPTAPPRDPNCQGDNSRILINGKSCVDLLTSSDGLSNCDSNLVKQYCCESRVKYCKATPISCDGSVPPTPKPTPPKDIFTVPQRTTEKPYVPPSDVNCGQPCSDTPNMRINSQTCADLLGTTTGKRNYCDNPTIIQHCCSTRQRVCAGYHWITASCDPACQDNASMNINGQRCVEFLGSETNRENFCDASVTKQHCCATRRKMCKSVAFG